VPATVGMVPRMASLSDRPQGRHTNYGIRVEFGGTTCDTNG
jgi:hypothetical protein